MARAVVTGGAGFLGSHLSDRLLAEGYDVVAVDNLVTGSADNIAHLRDNPRFEYVRQDIIQPYTVDGPVDMVYHFASPASPVDYLELPLETLLVGSVGTHNTLDLARDKGARFLVASTSEVYGDPLDPPAAGGVFRQRQPERHPVGLRRGQALRRGRDVRLPPQVRDGRQDRKNFQYLRTPHEAK